MVGNFSDLLTLERKIDLGVTCLQLARETLTQTLELVERRERLPTTVSQTTYSFEVADEQRTLEELIESWQPSAEKTISIQSIDARAPAVELEMRLLPPSYDNKNSSVVLRYDAAAFSAWRASALNPSVYASVAGDDQGCRRESLFATTVKPGNHGPGDRNAASAAGITTASS